MLLSLADLAALAFFLAVWTGHSLATEGRFFSRASLSTAMNRQREAWMRTMARRELRMIDTSIMQGLQQGTAFFGSSALIAIGGCFALLGSSDQVLNVLGDLPLSQAASRPLFEVKVIGLALILAYSFFKFGWSYRLFNYCSILIGAVPLRDDPGASREIDIAVERAARMNVLAGKHFNAGMRGIFFSIGYLGWFLGPVVFAVTTLLILAVLVRRQFFSQARRSVVDA
ncbi:DUF599 domain-containing protein [Mesorhizobium sp. ZMM04-5]|uniref:DUF599 domain-containing protein n=1 Tax=Mesorhizobium marinum TaxID=3228790 RepID=A0ABV3R524_9HYPH